MANILKFLPKWQNFAKSGHTAPSQMSQFMGQNISGRWRWRWWRKSISIYLPGRIWMKNGKRGRPGAACFALGSQSTICKRRDGMFCRIFGRKKLILKVNHPRPLFGVCEINITIFTANWCEKCPPSSEVWPDWAIYSTLGNFSSIWQH